MMERASIESRVARTQELRDRLQGDVWVDSSGAVLDVEEMTPQHAANVERLLLAIGPVLHEDECASYCLISPPTAEMASYYFEMEVDELFGADPERWLRDQPLMVALRERAGGVKPSGTCAVDRRRS